jgi:hypothetical protein
MLAVHRRIAQSCIGHSGSRAPGPRLCSTTLLRDCAAACVSLTGLRQQLRLVLLDGYGQ